MPKRWCSILHPSRREEEDEDAGFSKEEATDEGFGDAADTTDAGFNDEDAADADGFGFGDV